MSFAIKLLTQLKKKISYVLAVAAATSFVNAFHSSRTIRLRKEAKVELPNAYASAAEAAESKEKYLFNCGQRAHANFIENQTSFLTSLLIAGISLPTASALLGASWLVARVMYAIGYTSKNKKEGKGRYLGGWWVFPHLSLMGMALYSSWQLLNA